MATTTFAQASTALTSAVKPFTDLIADYSTIISSIDTAEQNARGDYLAGAVSNTLAEFRRRIASAQDPRLHRVLWNAWGLEVMRQEGLPFANPATEEFWYWIHRSMVANGDDFNDRNLTVASTGTADGGNTGDGTLSVLAVDWTGLNLQYPTSETKTWECIQDQNTGRNKGNELFQVRGEDASKDLADETGSGGVWRVPVQHAGAGRTGGGSVLQNSSFDSSFSGSGTDKIPGWTIGTTAGDFTRNTSTIYQLVPGRTTGASLQIAAGTDEITQKLSVRDVNALGERVPWVLQVAIKKTGSSDTGTVTLKCGSQSQAFNIANAPFNNTNWNVARLDIDKDLYYHNWKEDDPDIEVEWSSTSDVMYLDALKFAPMTQIDGLWYWLDGGETAFLRRDLFTHAVSGGAWADAEMMNSARIAGLPISLPTVNNGTETVSDP